MLYNIPGRTGVGLSIETIERLAAHPNILAIKEATGSLDLAAQIVVRTDLTVLSGDDPLTLPLALARRRGRDLGRWRTSRPDQVAALCDAFLARRLGRGPCAQRPLAPARAGAPHARHQPGAREARPARSSGSTRGPCGSRSARRPSPPRSRLRELMADLAPEVAGATV